MPTVSTARRAGTGAAGASLVLACVMGGFAAFFPGRRHVLPNSGGSSVTHVSLAHDLPGIAVLFVIPIALAGVGLVAARRGHVKTIAAVAALLWIWEVVGLLSWWVVFLPSTIAMAVCFVQSQRAARRTPGPG